MNYPWLNAFGTLKVVIRWEHDIGEPKRKHKKKRIAKKWLKRYGTWELTGAEIMEVINAQPVLNQERRWIPCSEGLPKEEGFYLVTLKYKHGAETNIRFFKIENGEGYWSKWGREIITAWMPKPEPYKGVTE